MRLLIGFFIVFSTGRVWTQDLTVPQEILDELETVVVAIDQDTFLFRVAYPKNYDKTKEYKCFVGFSGGEQTLAIVNYCYPAWFRSGYLTNYITVLPVANRDTINFKAYSDERYERLYRAINETFRVSPSWLVAGTSDGGIAAFNFVAAFPDRFEGIITAPGKLTDSIVVDENWKHLKVVLAYGELDDKKWIKAVKATAKRLKKSVNTLTLVPLKGQGHILPIKFNIDKIYDPYFILSE